MNHFNIIRMRSYLEHLIAGSAALVIGLGILYGIISEMLSDYLPESRYAYLFGIILCGCIIIVGAIYIIKAFYMDKRMFTHLDDEEKKQFYQELSDETTLFFGNCLIITQHYVLAFVRRFDAYVHIWRLDDLTACYGKAYYSEAGGKPESYHLILSDSRFKPIRCIVKGAKAEIMDEAYHALCSLAPWVLTDNAEEFMDGRTRKAKEKSYLKEIEHRKAVMSGGVSDDTLPIAVVTAADIIKAFNEQQKMKPKQRPNPKNIFFHKN